MTANSPTPTSPIFTDAEVAYLADQPLGRIATVGADGTPHVVPVGFLLSPDQGVIDIGGLALTGSKKWRDLTANPRVALVVDDLESVDPWTPRGVEIRGRANLHEAGGRNLGPRFGQAWIRIHPERIIAWGIDGDPFAGANSRDVH
jgi:pyridoxamine 5'-phosphate oxidase family protein